MNDLPAIKYARSEFSSCKPLIKLALAAMLCRYILAERSAYYHHAMNIDFVDATPCQHCSQNTHDMPVNFFQKTPSELVACHFAQTASTTGEIFSG